MLRLKLIHVSKVAPAYYMHAGSEVKRVLLAESMTRDNLDRNSMHL